MDVGNESQRQMAVHRTEAEEPLPDLSELSLPELRTIQHPVLREVVEDLRERSTRPSEMLWGFNSAL
ncbi:FxSxx-COOH cyclophane-containing RiPP peptide [Streptomyces sp. HUAS TT20]|uniref:FxSxx-COOH cyclophane-containing RiPP peptide n=1 Tax=Streptomyces sp. HUAS TT20 TaxID=3447509 RepID=UPI0021DA1A44|nr:FxSxx-COOH cyclophane-containing RiPP peptide [Streptomyces sp. HUAS 15-9]UXY29878.1 FxSxx-COOH protein [Streptomyces sp. HUAS 15-9]